jgi:hypothetical protein
MKLPRRNFLHLAAGAAALPAVSRFAWAQAYPSRPVRLIVPVAPGGAIDILARLMGQWLSERLGQQFVIDNRPGGGLNIGTEAVVRAGEMGGDRLQEMIALSDRQRRRRPPAAAARAACQRARGHVVRTHLDCPRSFHFVHAVSYPRGGDQS